MNKRDDLKQERQTAYIISLRKKNLSQPNNNFLTKSGKNFYTEIQGEEKGCSCEAKDVCNIY